MPSGLMPLSGAILISNPRTSTMAKARRNSARRRINRFSREVVRLLRDQGIAVSNPRAFVHAVHGRRRFQSSLSEAEKSAISSTVASVVAGWPKGGKSAKGSKGHPAHIPARREARTFSAAEFAARPKTSAHGKAVRRATKLALAKALGLKSRWVTKGKARRFRYSGKRSSAPGRGFLKGQSIQVINVPAVRDWNAQSVSRRAAGQRGHKMADYSRATKVWGQGTWGPSLIVREKKGNLAQYPSLVKAHAARAAKRAAANPGTALVPMGDLAFTNPAMNVTQFATGYVLPVTVAGAGAGAIHAFASNSGLTDQLAGAVAMIPAVGPAIAENAPFTLQGTLAGAALGALAYMVGGQAGYYIALLGGATFAVGAGVDAFNLVLGGEGESDEEFESGLDEDLTAAEGASSGAGVGDLAFTNVSALGDLAFTNVSALGDGLGDLAFTNMGDGMAFETAPLTGGDQDYAQTNGSDATYCGADFSAREGQALCNGREAWLQTYGAPPRRVSAIASKASHLAGREGHRWGWLIHLVGWGRAQQIANMPPQQRVMLIARLRATAVRAFNQTLRSDAANLAAAVQAPAAGTAPYAPSAPAAAASPNGADGVNFLGEPALFMGA